MNLDRRRWEELNITEGLLETVSSSRLPNCRLQFPVQSRIPHSWQPLLLVYLGLFMKHSHYTGPGTQPLIMTSSTIIFPDSFIFDTTVAIVWGPYTIKQQREYVKVKVSQWWLPILTSCRTFCRFWQFCQNQQMCHETDTPLHWANCCCCLLPPLLLESIKMIFIFMEANINPRYSLPHIPATNYELSRLLCRRCLHGRLFGWNKYPSMRSEVKQHGLLPLIGNYSR